MTYPILSPTPPPTFILEEELQYKYNLMQFLSNTTYLKQFQFKKLLRLCIDADIISFFVACKSKKKLNEEVQIN